MAATQRLELMPVIKIATQIPFSSIDPNVVLEESLEGEVANDDTPNMLEVKSCLEFLNHVAPMGVLAGTKKLSLVLDDLARPTILTIGEDSKLYYLLHAENPVLGSELVDVTPQLGMDVIVTAFDAYEDSRKVVFIAAAVKHRSGETIIYHSSFNHRALRVSQREGKPLREALQESLEWQSVLNNEGSKEITSIVCGPSSRGHPSSPAFQMTVGTIASEKKEGFPFVVDPFLRPEAPWMLQPLPRASKRIIDMQSTTDGLLILLEQPSGQGNACNFRQFSPVSGNFLTDNRILMTTKSEPRMTLGQPLTICGFQNVEGETDLLVGGSEGLGFYNWHSNTMPSQVILREKTITQVVASESRVKRPSSDIVSKISIFTVTENGELHFVEGTRNENSDVTLRTSGLPIRKGVQLVSSQYNSIRGICELVYVVRRGNQVRHLHRDDDTSFWTDTPIMFQAAETARTFPAYVTTVTLSSQRGDPVPEGYEVELRGDPTCVLIDDCNYYLDKRGLRVPVNDLGSLTIVTPTEAGLDFPTITLGIIVNNDVQDTVELDPAARVKKNLGKFGNAKDLQNAKSSTGLLVFEGLADEKAETAASLIRGLPTMMAAIQNGQNPIHNKNTEQPVTSTHFCDSSNSSNRKPQGGDTLFNEALKIWDDFIGDCCEFLEQVSYHVALVNFSVLGRAIEFFLTISGKVIRFGVKSVRAALKTVVQGVGMVTGLDTEGFLHLFGLTDDTEDILKTQEILSRCLETMMKNAETFVVTNEKGLHQVVGDLRAELQRFIPDKRPKFNKLPGENPLGWLLDHPVTAIIRRVVGLSTTLTNSVVSGITRAWQDAMQHRFKAPDLSGIASALQEAIKEILSSGLTQVMEQLTDILQTVKGVLSNPEEAFNLLVTLLGNSAWRIFDLLSQMLFSVMSLLRKIISTIIHAAGEEWQIPGLTSLWEEFSGQRFTISNFITYCCASIMNKWFMMIYGKPPVEVLGDFSGSLTPATPEDIDIYSLAHTNSHARPPQPEQSTSNSEIKSNVDGPKPEGFCHATSTDKILSVASSDIETSDTTADISQSTNVPGFLFQDSDMQPLFILESPFEKMLDGLPAAGRMSAKRPVVRSTKEGSISHKPGDLELVKAGKARYDSAKAWTGLIGSIARCFACALEFQQLRSRTREERISGRRPDYRYGMPQLIQAICGFTQLGSRVALIMEYTKLQHLLGDNLGEQVNADHQRLVISSVISIAGSAIGSLLALVHHEGMNEAGVMMLCGATFLDIWIVRIPDGLHSTAEGFEVVSEMSASVFGVGTCVFALKHAYNYALISCALDAVGTCTAVVATSIHLIH